MPIQSGIIYESKEDNITISGNKMNFSIEKEISLTDDSVNVSEPRKRGRPKKVEFVDSSTINTDGVSNSIVNELSNNLPYNDSYKETNNMLKSVIYQSDNMSNDINKDLTDIRSSRTLKKKYDYISLLSSTSSALLGTKVTAIRELNKSITDSHNLEIKRAKELKLNTSEEDDDKKIMDMYNAFISTPVGIGGAFIPQAQELNYVGTNNTGIELSEFSTMGNSIGMQQALTPEQNKMRYERNPNIRTVVKFFSDTGARCFDVIDLATGASVENVSKPDPMFLDNLTIDQRNNIARDTNLDITYPLVVIGSKTLSEY